ncbi:MAG: acyl carrier protein [Clostridiales bacterium]|jgi:acyl carrier protein|nr:acyl carrier protein [Clostridiales bacterium]
MDELLRILSETCPGIDFENEKALIDDGLLDSFDIITIVSEIMDVFSAEISVEDLVPENFNSVQAIWALIEKRRN